MSERKSQVRQQPSTDMYLGTARRLLVVDDDPGDVAMIQDALGMGKRRRDIDVAGDGQEALDFLRLSAPVAGRRPDLVLLDLNMPRVDGRELLKALKESEDLRGIPVVVFTTSSSPDDINESYLRYANAYVTKPVDLDGFMNAVQRIDEFFTLIATTPPGRPLPL